MIFVFVLTDNGQLGLGDTANRGDGSQEMGDYLQFVDVAFTMSPTMSPTVDPTADPTADPSYDPTLQPTNVPSSSPTIPVCSSINVDLVNFNKFTASDMDQDVMYQDMVTNATRHAIADVASVHGIDHNAFNVLYEDVFGSETYGEGQLRRSLFVDMELCVFSSDDFAALLLIVENELQNIEVALLERLTALFPDQSGQGMEVAVYLPTEFRVFLKVSSLCFHF